MYAENLVTPHPSKSDAVQVQLFDQLQPGLNQAVIGELNTAHPELTGRAVVEIADEAARAVSRALWYRNSYGQKGYSPYDRLLETQETDCYGYTTVLSECLSASGIDHYIGYVNGHALVLVPFSDEKGEHFYLADALAPSLNQIVDKALTNRDSVSIDEQIAMNGRAAIMLDTEVLSLRSGTTVAELADKYPWLKFERTNHKVYSSDKFMGLNEAHEVAHYRAKYSLVLSLFPAERGRAILKDHAEMQAAIRNGDIDTACVKLTAMEGMFPELDARQRHDELRQLVDALCARGEAETAAHYTGSYFGTNFGLSHDSRIPEAKGDIMRKIARHTGLKSAAHMAVEAYKEAARKPRAFHAALAGKLSAAETLHAQLS